MDDFPVDSRPEGKSLERRRDRLRRLASRANFFRMLGAALLIYGAVGLAAALYAHGLVSDAFASARQIGSVTDEKTRAVRSLQSMSTTLGDASTTALNLQGSFKESQTSLTTASAVAADVAVSFRQVAQVASFQVFGVQPLAAMGQPFSESSDRLDQLALDLTRTADAVGANVNDAQRLSSDFARLKADVDDLARAVSRLPSDPTGGEGARRLETALSAMLVWIGLQGLAALFAGLALLLYPLRRVEGGG
jgi:hypothetical protein